MIAGNGLYTPGKFRLTQTEKYKADDRAAVPPGNFINILIL
jgi:hypothetical protein